MQCPNNSNLCCPGKKSIPKSAEQLQWQHQQPHRLQASDQEIHHPAGPGGAAHLLLRPRDVFIFHDRGVRDRASAQQR